MKEFNTEGMCVPTKHYMVDISNKLQEIEALIERGKYFTINRARQFGKTSTLYQLELSLGNRFEVISVSFEGFGADTFSDDFSFVRTFVGCVAEAMEYTQLAPESILQWSQILSRAEMENHMDPIVYLGKKITKLCRDSARPVVLLIDEVDKSTDNQVFLNFLGMLRDKYLRREKGRDSTFQSVILAGVYDVKNLKLKLRPDEEQRYNSPWNIAISFEVDMSFSPAEIATMLNAYECDHHTGMDVSAVSEAIYFYTSGYPFLVSSLCRELDQSGGGDWSAEAVKTAVKQFLKKKNTLFDDLIKNVENNSEIRKMIIEMLYAGKQISYQISVPTIELGTILGIWKEQNGTLAISNVIFERYLYDYSVGKRELEWSGAGVSGNQFIEAGKLNIERVLLKFQELMQSEYRAEDEKFLEQNGRLLFLCFIKPIINGTGFYYVEPQTRNNERMDIVVTYGGQEFIIELKIWRGNQYREEGIRQLERYMDSRRAANGYLLSFSFLKNKQPKAGWLNHKETAKQIFEIII